MVAGLIIGIVIVLGVAVVAFINQPAFGRLPQGERLEKIEHSPHYKNGEFQNIHPTTLMTSDKGRLRTMWDFLISRPDGLNPDVPVPAIKSDLKNLADDSNVMVWFGHSSYLLQLSGKRILVDPVFCMASPVSFVNKPFKGTDIYKPEDMPDIDYLVISHDHWDHLDYQTVIRLKDRIRKVICPLGVGEHFEYWGFDKRNIIELDWYESALPDENFTVRCLPARHFSGRGLTSNKTLWASLAILENGQYNEGWRNIHTMPQYLGQAAKDLKARKVVTVHHSKYALARHRWDEPLKNEIEMVKENSLELIVPVIGQVMNLDNK